MSKKFSWSAPPLSPEDAKLVAAYEKIGMPLDSLPYTDDFEKLVQDLDEEATDEKKAETFRRLLDLRKRAWLSRANSVTAVPAPSTPLSADDQELKSAYQRIGRPLDALPYTENFEKLIAELGKPKTETIKHAVFQRLLGLRKQGRLPSVKISFVIAPDHLIKTAEEILRSIIDCQEPDFRDIQAVASAYIKEADRSKQTVDRLQTNAATIEIESRSPPDIIEKAKRLRSIRLTNEELQEKVRKVANSYVLIAEKNQQLFDEFKDKHRHLVPPSA